MEFRLLSKAEIFEIYDTDLQNDFPKSEIKPKSMIEKCFDEGNYFARALFHEGKRLAYQFFIVIGDNILLDYFAVDAKSRGSGVGSIALAEMSKMPEAQGRLILLEVEDPDYSLSEADLDMRKRRLHFYARNNVNYVGVKTRVFTDDYLLLSPREPSVEVAESAILALYRAILPEVYFEKHVHLKPHN